MAVTWKKLAYEDDVITKAILTAAGDIIYADGSASPVVLAKGSDDEVLTLAAGVPSWAALAAPAAHAASHQNGGGDEISVAALSGLLADDQHVLDTEVTAVIEATPLNDLAAADGAVDFGLQQATDLVVMTVANEAALSAVVADTEVGQLCWATGELTLHVCTASVA